MKSGCILERLVNPGYRPVTSACPGSAGGGYRLITVPDRKSADHQNPHAGHQPSGSSPVRCSGQAPSLSAASARRRHPCLTIPRYGRDPRACPT